MPQLHFNFTNIPIAETCLWDQFQDKQRQIVIEILARLLNKAARADQAEEQTND
jgi:hypothetical protein